MHYYGHILFAFVAGASFAVTSWALSLRRYALLHKNTSEARYHEGIAWKAMLLAIIFMLFCFVVPARAQEPPSTWMQPATDGRIWHDLPPPANLVNAGLLLEHDARMQRSGLVVAVLAGTAGAIMYRHNEQVGLGIAGTGLCAGLYLNLRGIESRRRSGKLLQSGYQITNRYELVPDSVEPGPHMRIIPRR